MKYAVTLCHSQYSRATITIDAKSMKQAIKKADEIQSDQVEFEPFDGQLDVESVEHVTIKQSKKYEHIETI